MWWILVIVIVVGVIAAAIIGGMGFFSPTDTPRDEHRSGVFNNFIDWMM